MSTLIIVGINSFITLADAEIYFTTRLNSDTWDSATDTNKEKALITAYKRIMMQELVDYYYYFSITPQIFLDAQCEEAIALLEQDYRIQKMSQNGITSKSVGEASESYDRAFINNNSQGLISKTANQLIGLYIKKAHEIT